MYATIYFNKICIHLLKSAYNLFKMHTVISHFYFSLKELLLKVDLSLYFFFSQRCICWNNNQFFFYIIKSMNNCNHLACKFFYRFIYAKYICILFFTICSDDSFHISMINWIKQVFLLLMICS